MRIHSVLLHDGHKIMFSTGSARSGTYVLGDPCPDEDGIYEGHLCPAGPLGLTPGWWVIIKNGRVEAAFPWKDPGAGTPPLNLNHEQLEELQEHYGVPWE